MALELINNWWRDWRTYPSTEQKNHNVLNVFAYFREKGWTDDAIAGLCGNIEIECRLNPGLFEGRPINEPADPNTWKRGIGLTQWTSRNAPPQKLVSWAEQWGLDFRDGWNQCFRIYREQINEYQWASRNVQGITFTEWAGMEEEPERMSDIFARAYERASQTDFPRRRAAARMYWDLLKTEPELPEVPPDPVAPMPQGPEVNLPIWLLFKFNKRRF